MVHSPDRKTSQKQQETEPETGLNINFNHNLSSSINPSQKGRIVGRTGQHHLGKWEVPMPELQWSPHVRLARAGKSSWYLQGSSNFHSNTLKYEVRNKSHAFEPQYEVYQWCYFFKCGFLQCCGAETLGTLH